MNRMRFNIILILMAFSFPLFFSCNYLDVDDYFNETLAYDSIFHNKRNLEKYLWGTAAYFPEDGNIFGDNYTPGPFATDEAFSLIWEGEFRGVAFAMGKVTSTNSYGMDIWPTMYKIIRKTNTILARMDEATDMTAMDKKEMLGYVHFMRGYAYYHLLMQYGPAVLLGDDVLESNEAAGYYDKQRATYDETVEYVCSELETAAKYLPVDVPVNYFGRPTQGAAYGLIARVRLQHASPLFNGQAVAKTYFGNWKRSSDGVNYVSQTYDENRWAVAAWAAKRIIDLDKYHLHIIERQGDTPPLPANVSKASFPYGAGNVDPFRSYSYMFNGESLASRNDEFLWACPSYNTLRYTRHSFPVASMDGYNGFCIPQKVIDNFYMADGRDIHNPSDEYPYSETGEIGGAGRKFSGYTLRGAANNMYNNREMRFYASIGFSECLWLANSTSESARKNLVVTYYYDGLGGKANVGGDPMCYCATGYVLRKYIHDDDAWAGSGAQQVEKSFPTIRYAEILLSYVEALNNLTGAHTITDEEGVKHTFTRNTDEIKFYFNQVRYRAGLPGMTDEEAGSPETVQKLIERERMSEFLCENRRFFDVRRWGIYEDTEKELIMGMNVEGYKDDYYQRTPVNSSKVRNRVVDKKLVFMPIMLGELRKCPSLDQNPGYEN